jgi:hypothetical protein
VQVTRECWTFSCLGCTAALSLLIGCSQSVPGESATFTLASGVKLVTDTPCASSSDGATASVDKTGDNAYAVRVRDVFQCDGTLEPFLTEPIDKKATLVLTRGSSSAGDSACECSRAISVAIENRLESGDTLYILNDYRVTGHLIMP